MTDKVITLLKTRMAAYKDMIHQDGDCLSHDELVDTNARICELEEILAEIESFEEVS